MFVEPAQELTNASGRAGYARVCSAVVEVEGVPIRSDGVTARKGHAAHVSIALVFSFGPENPGIFAKQALVRFVECKERNSEAVERSRCCVANPVVEHPPRAQHVAQDIVNRRPGYPGDSVS